jgi:arylsulfatase A-like enzyme
MSESNGHPQSSESGLSRRDFIKGSAVAAAFPASAEAATSGKSAQENPAGRRKPNIVLYISDQFRWDMVSAYGLNPMQLTPNLDAMARRGTLFRSHITNQPVCAPSRAALFTGQYQNKHGVWRNGPGLAPDAVTLATELRKAGYTANYIGKWHLAPRQPGKEANTDRGRVAPEERGGFLDVWEGSNELEWTSHPYEGEIYDGAGKAIPFSDVYRADFITARAKQFLNTVDGPFLLVISQLEVHQQNDCNCFVAPKEYAGKYTNPFVPGDLKDLPGDWQKQLPDYCGAVKRIDDSVGEIRKTLADRGLEDDTIFLFLSDHGCHFRTRNGEYKRSPHESSIHVPLVIQGPGFDRSLEVPELTSQIDITPTLLSAAGLPVPASMQGRSFLPLLDRKVKDWRNEVYVQMSEAGTGRALRTPEWTYGVMAPGSSRSPSAGSDHYQEEYLYNLRADPHQLLNLAGRRDTPGLVHGFSAPPQQAAAELRERLLARMVEAGEPKAQITEREFYP